MEQQQSGGLFSDLVHGALNIYSAKELYKIENARAIKEQQAAAAQAAAVKQASGSNVQGYLVILFVVILGGAIAYKVVSE